MSRRAKLYAAIASITFTASAIAFGATVVSKMVVPADLKSRPTPELRKEFMNLCYGSTNVFDRYLNSMRQEVICDEIVRRVNEEYRLTGRVTFDADVLPDAEESELPQSNAEVASSNRARL